MSRRNPTPERPVESGRVYEPVELMRPPQGEVITFRLVSNSVVGTARVVGFEDEMVRYKFSDGEVGAHALADFGPWRVATPSEIEAFQKNVVRL